jgi:hypothetical protein
MNKSWVTTFVVLSKSIWSSLIVSLKTNVNKHVVHNKCKWRCTQWFLLTCMLKTLQLQRHCKLPNMLYVFMKLPSYFLMGNKTGQQRNEVLLETILPNIWNWAPFKTLKINNHEYHLLMTKIYAQNGTMLSRILQLELWGILICLSSIGFVLSSLSNFTRVYYMDSSTTLVSSKFWTHHMSLPIPRCLYPITSSSYLVLIWSSHYLILFSFSGSHQG